MTKRYPTREEILRAVARVFAQKGFEPATVRELARAAGVSQGTLYYHIGSKSQALLDILNAFVDVMIEKLSAIAEGPDSAEEKLSELMEVMLGTVASNRTELSLFLRERRALPRDAEMRVRAKSDRIDGILHAILAEGSAQGCWNPSISLRAARLAIFGMVSWAVEWWNPKGPMSYEEFAHEFTKLVLQGLLPGRSALAPEGASPK